ncbi:phosphatidylinositol-glycan biosynthesis class F protein-like [Saccostrea echinata]|uniref:phosphatidylinositol-glycan biosynthesis class F protein-like n=1 Tax=Saccostrea echinata TaxID=191078 RepID=UPI002A8360DA|nr:phosphatidylinositol-glycan biosynthesis class F protein-like [Saccostrea echinata]
MSAPMNTRLPSKDVYYFTIRSNIYQVVLLSLLIFLPWNTKTVLDIVSYTLLSSEILIGVILCSNFLIGLYISQKSNFVKKSVSYRVRAALKGACFYVLAACFFHVIAVLYGAPFFESISQTFHFGALLASMAVFPGLCLLGLNVSSWIKVFSLNSADLGPESVVQITAVSSIIGAWLGAFPIPLDWDRDWQEWPITCMVGTLLGYMTGLIIAALHLCIRYNQLRKHKVT